MEMKKLLNDSKKLASQYTTWVTFVGLLLLLSVLTQGNALRWNSIRNLLIAESVRSFAALGVGMIIITKGIDLSIGYVVCLTASVAASFAQNPDYASAIYAGQSFPLIVPVVAAVAAGGLFGLFNGYLIAYGKLPPFIATLGSMSIAKGLQLIYTKAAVVGSLNQNFKNISQGSIGPIPNLIIYVIIAAFIVWVVLKHTRQGTHFYAIGGNAQAARVSGINVERDLMMVYTYAGILYGIAGTLLASRLGLANSLTANGMELDAIAAVTVGGVSQSGGVGSVSGMMVGVFTMGLINYGMSFLGVDSYYQQLVKGFIIIVAVYFDMKKYARRS
ncbi:monosaccharide ABC transporter membrane protein, CUT2 family [Sphaerochaeta associata]|jgi:methyl-galactoside transport system permease protein|uniref:Autoinducer 2 import system permease protein LsrD n=2 Tax=Sphaerochaeta TaxID=399320 RepID=A0ABY4DBK3_9SPIR|nr:MULTISPECIES: ABC transporter permease [Sphaerochaeta]MDD3423172.1 ABC transporter permease [Sphaerochaeta sp.]NLA97933.1 ABC transporter permease [Spirochaetales bacterium]UOM50322.1 ABC transporter permease [Sphaerochaeta associata]SMP42875.1 monosaccharide ABC transporter membrane protein, CUT2 family [Sphaerochaeta associata]